MAWGISIAVVILVLVGVSLFGLFGTSLVFALEAAIAPQISIPDYDILFEIDEKITSEGEKFKTSKIYENLATAEHILQISPLFKINTDIFNNESVVLPYFDGLQTFQTTSIKKETESKFIWKGHVEKSLDHAIIVVNGENVVGNIHIDENLYSIKPLGAGFHVLVEVNIEAFIDEPTGWEKDQPVYAVKWYQEFGRLALKIPMQFLLGQIDLMVLYTENVDGLVLDIDDEIALALEETNDSHVNSDSRARYRVVHSEEVDYNRVNSATDLERLTLPDDNHLDFAHDLRDEHGADVVLLIVDVPGTGCGRAAGFGVNESQAFAVVDYACATGYFSFGHEIGHLHGARHIVENDPSDEPFEYGHGLCDPDVPNEWRTIMAYSCPAGTGGPRIQYWSNPDVTFTGDALGTEELHDNARVMDETFEYVCSFRDPSCTSITVWREQVTIFERNYEFCFSGFPTTGGLPKRCINEFDPCGCGIQAPVCKNMLCANFGNLQELIIFTQLQEFRPYKLINLGVEPSRILPRDGMVMLDSDMRDTPIRVKATSAEKLIERNPSWSIRIN